LYVATADGVASPGSGRLDPARVNEASVRQWALCARLAVALEQREPYKVWGEPRLRAAERHAGDRSRAPSGAPCPTAGPGRAGRILCCFPMRRCPSRSRLSCRSRPPGLAAICRAWARCRLVSEVRYYAPPHVARADSVVHAHDAIRILSLDDALKEPVDVRFAA
jgi:hypothetical protein